ncbi:glycosyltransferase family 4 protein [Agrobacterium sp. B1(2019)]|uniref:glycosyltransferase family 4 protein n=1 Tax=Agrobacterium sp. B1(2019) TaxID=2607032 RepID=UPI0011ED9111|nr:glycosyltransferase family 4 protein [Agrobacterium sp. B1(2019)]TZG32204.1 glycosyltransferase family 4 protein [Agrobacterium sp. B1(2019)]
MNSRCVTFAFPGDLTLKTGGYAYDRHVITGLQKLGWTVECLPLGEGFPFPTQVAKRDAEHRLSELPDGALVVIDGLAFGILDQWAVREAQRLRIVALVHHPLALETGLDAVTQRELRESERHALSCACDVIVTSTTTARELTRHYDVGEDRLVVAIPGTNPALPATCDGDPPHIVSIGSLTRRKGHDVLIDALKRIETLSWRVTIAGSETLDAQTAAALHQQVDRLDLSDRIQIIGECNDAQALLASADIFALASRFEGYGMVFAEALSQGLPIVACRAGAIPEVVPEDAAEMVAVDDIDAFSQALRNLITNKDLRRRKAQASRRAGAQLPGWDQTVGIISTRLETIS